MNIYNYKRNLKRILDLHDQLTAIRNRMKSGGENPKALIKLKEQWENKTKQISEEFKRDPSSNFFGNTVREFKLDERHIVLFLYLLKHRIEKGNVCLSGRDILTFLFDSSFSILEGTSLLHDSSPLRTHGIITPERERCGEREDLLEMGFKLSDRFFAAFCAEFLNRSPHREPKEPVQALLPFHDNFEYLLALKELSLLHQERAKVIFDRDSRNENPANAAEINKKIRRIRKRIAQRLKVSLHRENFSIVKFAKEFQLNEKEQLIVVTLLFQEVIYGNLFFEAVELLKLVSSSERELLTNWDLFSLRRKLVGEGIVVLDGALNEKELTTEVYLSKWVMERLLTLDGKKLPIDANQKIDFHHFMETLDDSREFFKHLES